jgi:Na+-transporting NADH:ubiquinone oxidoreductase subunit F
MDQVLFILAAMVVFTGVILLLVFGLILASKKLAPGGTVKITINDGAKEIEAEPGSSLLTTLAENKIFLPSACGGGGTCAMCKCKVVEGGGALLPTEAGQVSKQEAREGVRLSCQLKVKENLKLEIPPDVMEIRKFEGTVVSNGNVATFIKELIVQLPEGMDLNYTAGGYIQIDIPSYELSFRDFKIEEEYRGAWDEFKLWDLSVKNAEPCFRAYSMASYPAEGNRIMLNVRIATPPPGMKAPPGIASSYIFGLQPGDKVVMSGPFGEFFAKDTGREMVYIGGGAGMAPMRSHIFDLLKTKGTNRRVSFWYGARSAREMFYDEEFKALAAERPNFSYTVALSEPQPDDGWDGPVGFIHQVVLDRYLRDHDDPQEIEYYLCGPPPMIAAVNRMLDDLGVEKEMIAYDEFG